MAAIVDIGHAEEQPANPDAIANDGVTDVAGPASQPDLQVFLERALAAGGGCRRIDTHAARIFLTGDRAWKLKRAVRYPYLDFSTPDARRTALEAELRLNRRTAPDIYLAVHPIVRSGASFAIDGPGEPVDWILEMRRFPDGAILGDLAGTERFDAELMIRLADRIHRFHRAAAPAMRQSGAEDMLDVIEGNADSLAPFAATFGHDRVAALLETQRHACRRHAAILDLRGRKGRIRHGHGDLHLANIALIDGEPVLFDCLEFDEALATTDTLYDLAFLLMDCWFRGLRTEANLIFNRYIDVSADEDGVRLLPLFLSLRATVRAHVMAATAQCGTDPSAADAAHRYFALAEAMMRSGDAALVAVGGLSGTGKSAVARAIGGDVGTAPGARILRSDILRKRLAGVGPEQRLSQSFYSQFANRVVYDLLDDYARLHLSFERSVIVDAVFAGTEERQQIQRAAAHARVPFIGCWLEASEANRLVRVERRTGDASDADTGVVRLQSGRDIPAPTGWRRVPADDPLARVAMAVRTEVWQVLDSPHNQARGGQRRSYNPLSHP